MATMTQCLLDVRNMHREATVVLRSGKTISGQVERVDLHDAVVVVDGWNLRTDEIAGFRIR
jgi:small nuclear ribonucleoprotein (snRNP)-like protein